LRENALLKALPLTARALLKPYLRNRVFPQGSILWEPGSPPRELYFPHSGLISLRLPSNHGSGIEIASISREGVAGVQEAFGRSDVATVGLTHIAGTFTTIGIDEFADAAQADRTLSNMAGLNRHWIRSQCQITTECNASHSARESLCRWLLLASDRMESATVVAGQESIADGLGLLRTTVILLTEELQATGSIHRSGDTITILDRALLESNACSCYAKMGRSYWPSSKQGAPAKSPLDHDT
jgi:CRP-like cAMP-binding protein